MAIHSVYAELYGGSVLGLWIFNFPFLVSNFFNFIFHTKGDGGVCPTYGVLWGRTSHSFLLLTLHSTSQLHCPIYFIYLTNIYIMLPMFKLCAKCYTWINLLKTQNNPMRSTFLSAVNIQGNWDTEIFNNLTRFTQRLAEVEMEFRQFVSKPLWYAACLWYDLVSAWTPWI